MPDGEGALHWEYLPGNTVHGIHSAPMMAEVEEDIKLRFPQGTRGGYPVVPLMLSVWRDGVKLTKKSSVYPVYIQFMNVNEYLMRFAPMCCVDKLHRIESFALLYCIVIKDIKSDLDCRDVCKFRYVQVVVV